MRYAKFEVLMITVEGYAKVTIVLCPYVCVKGNLKNCGQISNFWAR